ncbi:EAL domain-containing protein [Pseudomonas sp. Marseille-QA0892]
MPTSAGDSFVELYLARHARARQPRLQLPAWLPWVLAILITSSSLLCLSASHPAALIPTWVIAMALSVTGVLMWQALAASAVATSGGYVLICLMKGEGTSSLEILGAGGVIVGFALLLGRCHRLAEHLHRERVQGQLLRQLCQVWGESEGSCLKEIDLAGRLQAMNARGMAVMEVCDFDSLRGADWLGFWNGEWEAPARRSFEQALLGQFSQFSGFCPTAAGTPKWWDVLLLPVFDTQGRVESILSLSWDVTSLRAGTEALRTSISDHKEFLDVIAHGFYRLDRDWRVVQANASAESILGGGDGDGVIGKTLPHLRPDLANGEFGDALRDAMDNGFARHFDWSSPHSDSWYHVSIHPCADGVRVFFSDVTENVTAIQHLQAAEARLRLTQRVGQFADWTFDLDQRRLELSEQARQLLSLPAQADGTVQQEALLSALHADDRLALVGAFLDITEGGSSLDVKVRVKPSAAADTRYFRFAGAIANAHGNRPRLLLGSVQDISEQEARERALSESGTFTRGIIDALPQCIAVLDERGRVITGNRAWADATPAVEGAPFGLAEGADYLAFCRALSLDGSEIAQSLLEGIEALLEGIGGELRLDYALSDQEGATRNLQAFVTLLPATPPRVVLVHEDITEAVHLRAALAEHIQRLKLVDEGSNDGIWEWRPSSNSLYVSERFTQLTGYAAEGVGDFRGWLMSHVHPDDAQALATGWSQHLEEGVPLDVEFRLLTARGDHWFRMRGKAEWAGETLERVAGALMDINFSRELLARVQASETRFREMLEHLPHVFWEYDVGAGRLTYLSPALEKVLGMPPARVYENQDAWLDLVHPEDRALAEQFRDKALGEHQLAEVEFRAYGPKGQQIWVRDRAFPFTDTAGNVVRMVGIAENITEARTFEAKLFETAHFDRATGLPNHEMFLKRLQQQCIRAVSDNSPFLVFSVGIERIRWVQHILGKAAEEELVRKLSAVFAEALDGQGYLAKLDSERYAVLLSRNDEVEQYQRVALKMLGCLQQPFELAGNALKVNGFIGMARFPEHGESAEALLRNSQAASSSLAREGRHSFGFFDPAQFELDLDALRLEAGLEHALERSEFTLHYQPKINLRSGNVCGAEALIRWQHPDHGLVSPLRFIPLLEETGLINEVGLWCIDQALDQLVDWQASGLERFVMAVNVSIKQLRAEFVDRLAQAIAKRGVSPECVELELTESITHGDEAAARVVNDLKALGVRIAVDDFGTGYATLGSLRSFVPDVVKIDKLFLTHLVVEAADRTIVRGVIEMGHALGMTVVAEGVESNAQRAILEQLRCDEIQGYLVSAPIEAGAFTHRFVRSL